MYSVKIRGADYSSFILDSPEEIHEDLEDSKNTFTSQAAILHRCVLAVKRGYNLSLSGLTETAKNALFNSLQGNIPVIVNGAEMTCYCSRKSALAYYAGTDTLYDVTISLKEV